MVETLSTVTEYLVGGMAALYGGGGGAGSVGTASEIYARQDKARRQLELAMQGQAWPVRHPSDVQIAGDTLFYKSLAKPQKVKPKKKDRYTLLWKLIGLAGGLLLIGWYYLLWWAFA